MEKKEIPEKKLSRKRWLPMLGCIGIGVILLPFKNSTPIIAKECINFLDNDMRVSVINLFGLVIGIFHFYHVGRHNESHKAGILRTLTGVFTSIASTIGYAYLMNSGLNFAIGVLNDFFNFKQFFIYRDQINYLPLALVTVFIVFISGYLLWKRAEECLYEIAKPSMEAEGVTAPNNEKP